MSGLQTTKDRTIVLRHFKCAMATFVIWLLIRFKSFPKGLAKLLTDSKVIKVGCNMQGRDLHKITISGFDTSVGGKEIPSSWRDLRYLTRYGLSMGMMSLSKYTTWYLGKRLPKVINHFQVRWEDVPYDTKLQEYATLDAFACYEVFGRQIKEYT